jgi:hypothetical protein
MKLFQEKEIFKAYTFASSGGQALHLFEFAGIWPGSPVCFKCSRFAAHLIDYDITRLKLTASELGVKKIIVSRVGQRGQHIDLCGRPLQKALGLAS